MWKKKKYVLLFIIYNDTNKELFWNYLNEKSVLAINIGQRNTFIGFYAFKSKCVIYIILATFGDQPGCLKDSSYTSCSILVDVVDLILGTNTFIKFFTEHASTL